MKSAEQSLRKDWQDMNKPQAIEGFWDTFLIRPLGFLFVYFFKKIHLSPTQVSFLSVFASGITAFFYYFSDRSGGVLSYAFYALLFFILSSAWDSADGQLARLTGKATEIGRTIDGFCDNLGFLAIYLAILLGYSYRMGHFSWMMFFIGILAGISHSNQSALTDYHRLLYLYYVHEKDEVVQESPDIIAQRFKTSKTLFQKILMGFHLNYSYQQRLFCRSSHNLQMQLTPLINENKKNQNIVSLVYKSKQLFILKVWALLGSNTHKIGIILAAFIPIYSTHFWGNLGMTWYFIYELIFLNVLMLGLMIWQKRIDHSILRDVKAKTQAG